MDIFVEQSVNNPDIDKRKKFSVFLRVIEFFCYAAIFALFLFFWLTPLADESEVGGLLQNALFYLLMMVPFVALIVFMRRVIANRNVEFDYFITDGKFRIVKIINRAKRKLLFEEECASIESIGKVYSQAYERYCAKKAIVNIKAFCYYQSESELIYIYCAKGENHYLIHITPNESMIRGLKRSVSRITVVDKSLNMSEQIK